MQQLPKELKELYPFNSNAMEIQGHQIHYLDEGSRGDDRPVVIMLHGNPTWSFIYREIIPWVRRSCRVIAPDYLGMGLSEKPPHEELYTLENHIRIITELIDRLKLKNVILAVQDWGGPIGLGYALEHLDNVRGMLFMNTWAWPDPSPFHAGRVPWRMMHAPIIGAHMLLRLNVLVDRGLYLSTGNREKMRSEMVIYGYRLPFSSPLSRVATLAFPRNIPLHPGDLNWDRMAKMEEGLKTLPFPCRLLWGEKDQVFPPENAHRFKKLIPDCSEPRMIPEGRHFIQEDAPKEVAEEILALAGFKRR